jgi:hypothetical protein
MASTAFAPSPSDADRESSGTADTPSSPSNRVPVLFRRESGDTLVNQTMARLFAGLFRNFLRTISQAAI